MDLTLVRKTFTEKSTIGELTVNGVFECFTLEDVKRDGPKVAGKTAIPPGSYRVVNSFSQRFQRMMPLLINVPGFEGVRIHTGNCCDDTEGCILVGRSKGPDTIGSSRLAYDALFAKLTAAANREVVNLTIKNA